MRVLTFIAILSIAATAALISPDAARAQASETAATAATSAPAPEAAAAATAVVEKLHAALIDVMKNADALGYDGRHARLEPVVRDVFDLAFMAEKSAGRHWKTFGDAQKQQWIDTFSRLTSATYAGRFDGHSGQHFETLGAESAGFDTLLVRTRLVQPADENVELNYRLRETPDGWKVVDIYLSGTVSELALRRAEYGSVLERSGFDKLVADLETKITEFRNGASG